MQFLKRAPDPAFASENAVAHYHLMGCVVASDLRLQDVGCHPSSPADVTVRAAQRPLPEQGVLLRRIDNPGSTGSEGPVIEVFEGRAGIHYHVHGKARFWINPSGHGVQYELDSGADHTDIEMSLTGPVLALALQLQGQVQLHASAAAIGSAAVAFAAPHGAGKSTLAASFALAGYPLLGDDIVPIKNAVKGVRAVHSLPRVKLWPDSLVALGDSAEGYAPAFSRTDKRRVRLGERWGEAHTGELPLAAVYLLDPHADPGRGIEVSRLSPVEATWQLLGNTYMAEALTGRRAMQALDLLTRLVEQVRVRRVSYFRAFAALPNLREAILADVQVGAS